MSDTINTAVPGTVAGILYQYERALHALASSPADASVGIETLDDVATLSGDGAAILEQEKHSLRPDTAISDHSVDLWKTLANWLDALSKGNITINKFVFVTNRTVAQTSLLFRLTRPNKNQELIDSIFLEVQRIGNSLPSVKTPSQKQIARACRHDEKNIKRLIALMELADGSADGNPDAIRRSIVDRLHLPSTINADAVLENLAGWLHNVTISAWRSGKQGWIKRQAFSDQVDRIITQLRRAKQRERASKLVPITAAEIRNERSSKFVHHLVEIDLDDDGVSDAIASYLKFTQEKFRLIAEGVVNEQDWSERTDRLSKRWRLRKRKETANRGTRTPQEIGQTILFGLSEHLEPLADQPTFELYLTEGHLHRMANDDIVWWHPDYTPSSGDENEG